MQKLSEFKQDGIELNMDMKNVSPERLVDASKKYLGMIHCFGGDGTNNCIDCSGLLLASFNGVDINPGIHNSQELARYGVIISDKNQLKKGDFVFFIDTYNTNSDEMILDFSNYPAGLYFIKINSNTDVFNSVLIVIQFAGLPPFSYAK